MRLQGLISGHQAWQPLYQPAHLTIPSAISMKKEITDNWQASLRIHIEGNNSKLSVVLCPLSPPSFPLCLAQGHPNPRVTLSLLRDLWNLAVDPTPSVSHFPLSGHPPSLVWTSSRNGLLERPSREPGGSLRGPGGPNGFSFTVVF